MKLWKIEQDVNTDYDTYDSAVVVAETAEEAVQMHPRGNGSFCVELTKKEQKASIYGANYKWLEVDGFDYSDDTWTAPSNVTATLVGYAIEGAKAGDVICASFNAG